MVTALDNNTALVLIDLQKGIVGYPVANPIGDVLANAAKLVAAFRKKGLPIVIVNVNPANATKVSSRKEQGARGGGGELPADWLDIVPEIETNSDDIFITKHTWGAFFETALQEELQKRNVTGIVLAGVATSIGVEGTARQASEFGYNLTFAKDAMTDMSASAQENSFQIMFPRMGEVDTTDAIIATLG